MLQVDFRLIRTMFFDRARVRNAMDARTRKVLSKFGAYVWQTSRKSIRKRKGTSQPGRPPFSHSGVLKRFIFFGYDPNRRSVVIGPVIAPGKVGKAPSTLEHGGKVTLPTSGQVDIAPRPFMQPAFDKELNGLSKLWAESIQ